jgi:hypothetical protein
MMRLARSQIALTDVAYKAIAFGIARRVSRHMNSYGTGTNWTAATIRLSSDRELHISDYTGNSFILRGPAVYETTAHFDTKWLTHHEWVVVAKRNYLADPRLPDEETFIMLLTGEREVFDRDMTLAALAGLDQAD